MARKIDEQIALVNRIESGEGQSITRTKQVKNSDGTTVAVEVQRRARAWWFNSEKGTLCLSIRYGAKSIEFAKGRNAIEVASVSQLVPTLEAVKKAVLVGELDSQIESAAVAVKMRFKQKTDR